MSLNILAQWFQNLALLFKQKIELPAYFDWIKSFFGVFLSFEFGSLPMMDSMKTYYTEIKRFTSIDYRVQFIVFNVVFPLFYVVVTLLLFKTLVEVIWYLCVLSGILILAAGIILFFITPDISYLDYLSFTIPYLNITFQPNAVLIFAGVFLLLICGLIGLSYLGVKSIIYLVKRIKEKKQLKNEMQERGDLVNGMTNIISEENSRGVSNIPKISIKNDGESEERTVKIQVGSDQTINIDIGEGGKNISVIKKASANPEYKVNVKSEVSDSDFDSSLEEFPPKETLKRTFSFEKREKERKKMKEKREKHVKCNLFNLFRMAKFTFYSLSLIIPGLFMVRALKFEYFGWVTDSCSGDSLTVNSCCNVLDCYLESESSVFLVVGIILLSCSLYPVFSLLLILTPWGRVLEWNVTSFVRHNALKIIFTIITLMFTPVITSCFNLFICSYHTCQEGYRFQTKAETSSGLFSFNSLLQGDEDVICVPCTGVVSNCSAAIVSDVCPKISDWRLVVDPSLSCFSDLAPFFWGPAALCAMMWIVVVPIFYCLVILKSSKKLGAMEVDHLMDRNVPLWIRDPKKAYRMKKKKKVVRNPKKLESLYMFETPREQEKVVGKNGEEEMVEKKFTELNPAPNAPELSELYEKSKLFTKKEHKKFSTHSKRWQIRTALTGNPVKSLFQLYEFKWRFFSVLNSLNKMLLVVSSVCLILYPKISVPVTLTIHLITTVSFFFSFPYIDFLEDVLNIVASISTLVTCLYLIFPTFGFDVYIPEWVGIIIIILNSAIPLVGIVQLLWSNIKRMVFKKKVQKRFKDLIKLQKAGLINPKKKINYKQFKKDIKTIDRAIVQAVMKYVLVFFMIIGVVSCISLLSSMLGLVYEQLTAGGNNLQTNVQYSAIFSQTTNDCEESLFLQFAGYDNFTDFSNNCCCEMVSYEDDAIYNSWELVERWSCRNGFVKEKVRTEQKDWTLSDGSIAELFLNGTIMRDFCSLDFNRNFYLDVDTSQSCEYTMAFGDDILVQKYGDASIDEYMRKYLW